jgi:hypothetical protein
VLLEEGELFVAQSSAQPLWERVSRFKVTVLERGSVGAVVLTHTPPNGKAVSLFIRASSGNALAGPLSTPVRNYGDVLFMRR